MKRVGMRVLGAQGWTGGANYQLTVAKALLGNPEYEYEPVVFAHPDTSAVTLDRLRSILGDRLVISPRVAPLGTRRGLWQSMLLGRDNDFADLVVDARCDVMFESADYFGWRFPAACLSWMPDFQDRRLPEMFSRAGRLRRATWLRLQIATRRAVLLSSEDARTDCHAYYPSSRNRTAVARFAVMPSTAPGQCDPSLLARYGLPVNFLYLPNQYWVHKNHAAVIEALRVLKQRGFGAVVASSGNPADPRFPAHYAELQQRVRDYGLVSEFRFLGLVESRDVPLLMRASAAVINPSLCEGWSTTVEEARALGVPLLLSNIPVHLEQAPPGTAFFDPRDAASIADAIGEVLTRQRDSSIRAEAERIAAVDAVERVRAFARDFAAACDLALRVHVG